MVMGAGEAAGQGRRGQLRSRGGAAAAAAAVLWRGAGALQGRGRRQEMPSWLKGFLSSCFCAPSPALTSGATPLPRLRRRGTAALESVRDRADAGGGGSRLRAPGRCLGFLMYFEQMCNMSAWLTFPPPPPPRNVLDCRPDPDHPALDVEDGVPPPRAAPPLLRRVVLSEP